MNDLLKEIEEDLEISEKIKANKKNRRIYGGNPLDHYSVRRFNRAVRSLAKPSYVLGLGSKTNSVRYEYRERLQTILRELLHQQNWKEASGVLSVLMQGTIGDRSPELNRLKYTALMQIQSDLRAKGLSSGKISEVYDTWISKIGKEHKEERLSVCIEQILHFFKHGDDDHAYQAAISLMQDRDLGRLPRSYLFIGLTFYELWYRKFLKELQHDDANHTPSISEASGSRSDNVVEYSGGYESAYSLKPGASAGNESEASVMNGRRTSHMSISDQGTKMTMKVGTKLDMRSPVNIMPTPGLYVATSDEHEGSLPNEVAPTFNPSLVSLLDGMESWLLPVKLPNNPDYYIQMLNNSYYKEAVKYMRLALQLSPHVSLAALHPLVQLLLMGGRINEAMKEVEKFCEKIHDLKAYRIRAILLETFHPDNNKLVTYYEDVLKIDGRCTGTVMKLINMHHGGVYNTESLIEIIASHLEVAYPEPDIWRELALCFLELCQSEEDRMSVCLDGTEEGKQTQYFSVRYNQTPKVFTDGTTGKAWSLRGKWWLSRHFSLKGLDLEIKRGDMLQLVAYKAACAAHMYGHRFGYVSKVYGLLDKSNNSDLFVFLQTHTQNSIGFYTKPCF